MFGDQFCTFIPNNTAPDSSVTKALEGLRALHEELAENSGIEGWGIDLLFSKWFCSWKGSFLSLATTVLMFMVVLSSCGCYIIYEMLGRTGHC